MRVAFVVLTDFPERTAPARRVHMMAKGLASRGHEVHVLVPQRFQPGPLEGLYDGLHLHWSSVANGEALLLLRRRIGARLRLIERTDRLIRSGLDWLITYNLGLDAVPMVMRMHERGGCVAAMYDDLRAYPQRMRLEDRARRIWLETADRWLPRHSQLNIVISTFLEQRVRAVAPEIPAVVIPPLVDLDRFRPDPDKAAAFRKRWNVDRDEVLISYLGSYWHTEGVETLLHAARRMADQGLRFRLSISGAAVKGLDCDDVSALVTALNLDRVAVQTGWLPTDDVIAAMSASDILVIPKLEDVANVAGVPTKLAEYLSMGRPVVASMIGDIPRYLTDGSNSLLCKPGDANALADALARLVHDSLLRQRLAIQARATASEYFDYRTAGLRVETSMHEAVSCRPPLLP